MSRLFRRLGRSMSSLLVGVLTIALLGALGTSLAFAAPASASSNNASQGAGYKHPKPVLTCDPKDPHLFGGCELKFNDITDRNGNKGLKVCFFTSNKDIVLGANKNCSTENARGNAYGVFLARVCGPSTVTGIERSKVNGKVRFRTATVTVHVRCGKHPG
jgi:hypothetical protein